LGLFPGKSGICVIDIDIKKGANPTELELPKTLTVKTANGVHLYFTKPEGYISNDHNNLPDKWDVRCDGGYVVIPPSIHPELNTLFWEDEEVEIAPLPTSIRARLEKKERTAFIEPDNSERNTLL